MAKFLSQVYTTIRGSVGGVTYTANQHAALVARARVSPVNPDSSAQNRIRMAFATASVAWDSLADSVREAWASYAATLTVPAIGGTRNPSGRETFMGTISLAWYLRSIGILGANPTYAAPTTAGFLTITNLQTAAPSTPGTGFSMNFYNGNGESVLGISARSFKQSPGRNFYRGPWLTNTLQDVEVADTSSGVLDFLTLDDAGVYFANLRLISLTAPFRISTMAFMREIASVTSP